MHYSDKRINNKDYINTDMAKFKITLRKLFKFNKNINNKESRNDKLNYNA